MYYKRFLLAPLLSSGVFDVTLAQPRNGNNRNGNNNNNSNNNRNNNALQLNSNAVQTASKSNGLDGTQDSGTSASATDDANFINFCSGKTLTNGQQIKEGSCNGIVMGEIPSTSNMISTIITKPKPGDFIPANTDFTIDLKVQNLVAGSFTNPQNTYYAAPQALQNGKIVGHTHVTVQNIGSFDTKTPPDPTQFVFFKGINDAGDGNGGLTATVSGGLPAGIYRVCTMTSASNHQPVLMPVAQRGAQDDCQKFTVFGGNNNNNNNNNNNQNNQNTNTTKKNGFGNGFGGFGGGFGQRGKGRFAKREFIA